MTTYLESVDSEWFNQRLVGVVVAVLLAFAVLVVRLLYLQVVQGEELRRLSEINSIRLQDIDAPRGLIFDSSGKTLVENRPAFNLSIILKDAKPLDRTIQRLSSILGETPESLMTQIGKSKRQGAYRPILIREDIGRDALAAIEVQKYALPGVVVQVSPRRHYLYGQHAAHILGYMGEISMDELQSTPYEDYKGGDFIGKFGIEKAYETVLRGKRGGRQVEVNATGQVVSVLKTVQAQPGQNIFLTIDNVLQSRAERLLTGQAGSAVAVDPNSGRILAMASSPSFDPNLFVVGMSREQWQALISNPFRPLENKAIQAEYPPASTYKIVTAIAGLEEGIIDAKSTAYCPGYYPYGNRIFRCWRRGGHGEVDVVKAIAQSCDVFFYQVGEKLGVDLIAHYAKAMGLGSATHIKLDREDRGLIPTADWKYKRFGRSWQGGETLNISIGQGYNLVTPIQMALLVGAVGNSGVFYEPFLIDNIQSADGEESFRGNAEIVRTLKIKPETMDLVHKGLWQVVNSHRGTAYQSRIEGLEFSGKTGTAQVVSRIKGEGEGDDDQTEVIKDHAWFVAYAPSIAPKIAVAVIIEHGEHGSSAAAPVARELIRSYLAYPADKMTEAIEKAIDERIRENSESDSTIDDETETQQ